MHYAGMFLFFRQENVSQVATSEAPVKPQPAFWEDTFFFLLEFHHQRIRENLVIIISKYFRGINSVMLSERGVLRHHHQNDCRQILLLKFH